MKRRDLLAGLALAATAAESQQPSPESVYIPPVQKVEDRKFLHDFMDEFSFVDLVTANPTIRIIHIPVLLDRTVGPYGTIIGHISRNNSQQTTFDGKSQAVTPRQKLYQPGISPSSTPAASSSRSPTKPPCMICWPNSFTNSKAATRNRRTISQSCLTITSTP